MGLFRGTIAAYILLPACCSVAGDDNDTATISLLQTRATRMIARDRREGRSQEIRNQINASSSIPSVPCALGQNCSDLRHTASPVGAALVLAGESSGEDHFNAALRKRLPLHVGLPIWLAFCAYCLWHGLQVADGQMAEKTTATANVIASARAGDSTTPSQPRVARWDVVKFFLNFTVIWHHAGYLVYQSDQSDQPAEWDRWLTMWKMAAFAYVSGVFGGSMRYDSISAMLCYTLGTTITMTLATDVFELMVSHYYGVSAAEPFSLSIMNWGYRTRVYLGPPPYWYLFSLCAWRLTISPVFYVTSELQALPRAVSFTIVWVLLYVCRHCVPVSVSHTDKVLVSDMFTEDTWYLGMFFALGLLRKPSDWAGLLGDKRFQAFAVIILSTWYLCLVNSVAFRSWQVWACVTADGRYVNYGLCGPHYPHQAFVHDDGGIGVSSIGFDLMAFTFTAVILLGVVVVIWLCASILEMAAPRLLAYVEKCGRRTLYSYVLSQFFAQSIFLGSFGQVFHIVPTSLRGIAVFAYAVQLHIVLTSSGCERAFRWLVMPFWIRDGLEFVAKMVQSAVSGPQLHVYCR